jgi:hypothetical protein
MFNTLMFERHHTKIAVFGGKPGENIEYKGKLFLSFAFYLDLLTAASETISIGMAGNQVLEWADLDSEIKTAGLKNVRVNR